MTHFHQAFKHIFNLSPSFWIVILATLINQLGNMAFVFLLLYLTKHIGFSLVDASIAFAIFSGSMLFSGLLGGNIIDQFGAVRLMIITLLANGFVLLIFPLLHHFIPILFFCLIWGFTFGLYRPASQTIVSHLSSAGLHKLTFSVYRLSMNLGMSIGPLLGGYLAGYSFSAIFIANGIANLLASMILLLGLRKTSWFSYRPQKAHRAELSIMILKRDVMLRYFVFAMVPVSMVFFQHEATLPVFLKNDLQLPLTFYGLLFTVNTLLIVFFELPLNILTLNWPYRVNCMLGSFFITLGFTGMLFANTEFSVLLLTAFWTLGEMILYPAASSYIADIAPETHRGSYMSMYSTCSNIGLLLGPFCGAIVMQHFAAKGLWLTCGFVGLISTFMFHYLKEPSAAKTKS